ncbi:type II toxin-antitoxin system VapC family toxin [Flavobacterium sp. MFBS3-15]|uniref:type II toxin-antitoxin system VapC family toxin n=1 Tax=Flavobacterium sp. MFBS3-15 TaxID=2989816 RepID=UPI002235812F|nr:type II toxin-antitoxin system VapC family toxin [Flavobacterium sp. MFBS3-15]MCW4469175.1 type II toxin-antitoxin system VapC family toxin [Flavobacterium sp. MFBS3-15]
MKKYLIDTNIAIFYMKGKFELDKKFDKLSTEDCYISEITLAELKFGIAKSEKPEKNKKALDNFLEGVQVLPIFHSLDLYASEKARLQKAGTPIDDFDLLIGVTSVTHDLIMVTNNTKHFKQITNIQTEDWILV